jgi:hypothetical protein
MWWVLDTVVATYWNLTTNIHVGCICFEKSVLFVFIKRSLHELSKIGAGNFPLYYRVQNGSGAHTAFYPVGTSGFPWG